jgi:hypothetical protein
MHSQNRWTGIVVGVVLGVLFSGAIVWAGSLEPSEGPTAAVSQMFTLDQIYNRINNGAEATKMTTFTEPSSGPTAGTMHTLDEIYTLAGLRAPVPRTGQTPTVPLNPVPAGSDGALQKGVTWPNPRFTDNNNGTVTDNLTGLTWLRNANCTDTVGGIIKTSGLLTWNNALTWSSSLAAGRCGLTDGSTAGQWRLPNVREMQSLFHYAFSNPPLPNTSGLGKWTEGNPFTGVQSNNYWSSTAFAGATVNRWSVNLNLGSANPAGNTEPYCVWPVRGGQ